MTCTGRLQPATQTAACSVYSMDPCWTAVALYCVWEAGGATPVLCMAPLLMQQCFSAVYCLWEAPLLDSSAVYCLLYGAPADAAVLSIAHY